MRKCMWQHNQKLFLHWKRNVQLLRGSGEICQSTDVVTVGQHGELGQSDVAGELVAAEQVSSPTLLARDGTREVSPLATTLPSQALSAPDFRGLEDRILKQSLETVDDSLKWAEIDRGTEEPPQEWIDELGTERAKQRLRVAKAAWMNAKEAPVGLGMARTTAVGIMKVRAAVKIGTPVLNVNLVNFPQPSIQLEVIDVDGSDK